MAVIKMVNESYLNKDAVSNLIYYICNYVKADYCGGLAVSIHDKASAIMQFMAVKHIYNKNEGRQARHFIVSFSDEEEEIITPYVAYLIGYDIAQYYGNRYQIMFAVHEYIGNLHIHFVFNSVSYIDGKMYAEGFEDFNNLSRYVNDIVDKYQTQKIKYYA